MLSRQEKSSGSGKHQRRAGDLFRCLKCVLQCLLSSEHLSSAHYRAAVTHNRPHTEILFAPSPSVPLAGTRPHTIPGKDAGGCGDCWGTGPRARGGDPPSYGQGTTSASALEPALWVPARNTAAPQGARSSQLLRLLVTQNLYTKDINLHPFPWVNHFNLEPDSTDVCKMALLDSIYFCIGGNNVDWSHKNNYKT